MILLYQTLPLLRISLVRRQPSPCFFMPLSFGSFFCPCHCFAQSSVKDLVILCWVILAACTYLILLFSCNTTLVTKPWLVLSAGCICTMKYVLLLGGVKDTDKESDVIFWASIGNCSLVCWGQGQSCSFPVSLFPEPDGLLVFLVTCKGLAVGGVTMQIVSWHISQHSADISVSIGLKKLTHWCVGKSMWLNSLCNTVSLV